MKSTTYKAILTFILSVFFLNENSMAQCGGNALNFNGTNQSVTTSANGSSIQDNFTMELWVNPSGTIVLPAQSTGGYDGLSGQRYAIAPDWGGYSNAGAGISVGTNGICVVEHADQYIPALLVYSTTLSGWNHIAVVYTNKQPSLYLNGTLVATGFTSPRAHVYPSAYQFGGGVYGYYNGSIDEFRVWNTVRTPAEIANNFDKTVATPDANLFAYYSLNESSGSSTADASGNGNTGTLINLPSRIVSNAPITTGADPTVPTLAVSNNPSCSGDAVTLSIQTGVLNGATAWQWYSGSCGGTSVGSGTSIVVSPTTTTTYYARGEGGCVVSGSCGSITITVNLATVWYADFDGDGLGDPGESISSCTQPANYVANNTDICPLANQATVTNLNTSTCNCEAGYYATTNTVSGHTIITACSICPAGTYCPDGLNSYPCPAGKYMNLTGAISCIDCPAGKYTDVQGLIACMDCPAGKYNPLPGATTCSPCPAGYYSSMTGSIACNACPVNTSQATPGSTSCVSCAPGSYQPQTAQVSCLSCPTITFTTTASEVCAGNTNGNLSVDNVNGGSSPYQYSINNGGAYQSSNTFASLAPGNYTVIVKDLYECQSAPVVVSLGDFTLPSISCPANVNTNTASGQCGAVVNYSLPSYSDNCISSTSGSLTFTYTGAVQTWTVPPGVSSISVDVMGAEGGKMFNNSIGSSGTPGKGGRVQGTLNVNAGDVLTIYVGGKGGDASVSAGGAGGYNGGGSGNKYPYSYYYESASGGGGGASDIRRNGTALANRVFVGAGGGGCGTNCAIAFNGGTGGGLNGTNGVIDCTGGSTFGYGGTQSAGGAAGTYGSQPATAGSFGFGGSTTNPSNPNSFQNMGGGGGAGYYGGGGGANGGGGGGSSYADAGAGSVAHTAGFRSGNGQVVINYTVNYPYLTQTTGLPSGSLFPKGTTTNTFLVTDQAGNTNTCTQTVTITDNQAPTQSNPGNQSLNTSANSCTASYSIPAPTIIDNCPGPYTWNAVFSGNAIGNPANLTGLAGGTSSPLILFNKGTTVVTLYGIDASNNISLTGSTFTVTVTDNVPPVLTCPPNSSLYVGSSCQVVLGDYTTTSYVTLNATVTSGSSGTTCTDGFLGGAPEPQWQVSFAGQPGVTYPQSGSCFTNPPNLQYSQQYACAQQYPDSIQVCFSAFEDDGAACIISPSCLVQVCQNFPTPAPGSSANYSLSIPMGGNASWGTVSFSLSASGTFGMCPVSVSDNCGGVTLSQSPPPGSILGPGSHTVSITATDQSNNSSTCTHIVSVLDTIRPSVSCPPAIVSYQPVVNYSVSASDNCGTPLLSYSHPPGSVFPCGNTMVKVIATDGSGNKDSCTFMVSVLPYVNTPMFANVCDTYTWPVNGQTYTNSGIYQASFSSQAGCDSSVYLILTIRRSTPTTTIASVKGCYTWSVTGLTYTVSGLYSQTFINAAGCDSTAYLNLTILPGVYLNAKVFLSGSYDASLGLMHDSLRVLNRIPLTEPYTSAPYNKSAVGGPGNETVSNLLLAQSGNTAIVDWVMLEVRDALIPSNVVANKRALLRRDGQVVATDGVSSVEFPGVQNGTYYLAVKHRNHLGVMTVSPVSLSGCSTANVDFTTSAPVYANALINNAPRKLIGSVYALWSGDANNNKNTKYNGVSNDKDQVLNAVGGPSYINNILYPVYRMEDVNMDGRIRYNGVDNDRAVILNNVGVNTPNAILYQHTPN